MRSREALPLVPEGRVWTPLSPRPRTYWQGWLWHWPESFRCHVYPALLCFTCLDWPVRRGRHHKYACHTGKREERPRMIPARVWSLSGPCPSRREVSREEPVCQIRSSEDPLAQGAQTPTERSEWCGMWSSDGCCLPRWNNESGNCESVPERGSGVLYWL